MKRANLIRRTPLARGTGLARTGTLKPVSAKRAAQNRARRAMVRSLWPERPRCSVPWCQNLADDLHEPLSRARGGAIDDPANAKPLCRPCHDAVTFTPESDLGWAYAARLLVHSWDGAA